MQLRTVASLQVMCVPGNQTLQEKKKSGHACLVLEWIIKHDFNTKKKLGSVLLNMLLMEVCSVSDLSYI